MAGIDRIVRRANLKEKLANLEGAMRTSKVIAQAQQMLQHVSREGFMAGYKACEADYDAKAKAGIAVEACAFDANPAENVPSPQVVTTGVAQVVDVVNNPTDQVQL